MILETQVFLNYFLEGVIEPLTVDGIAGTKTNNAIKMGIQKIKEKFSKHGFIYNSSFNFVGIRTNRRVTNVYDDWFVILYADTLVAIPASTKPGTPAILKYWNRWVKGIRGFGTIKENQQITYLLIKPGGSNFNNWSGGIGFLYQIDKFKVYRDPNTDNIIDTTFPVDSENDGFNVHSWLNSTSKFRRELIIGTKVKSLPITVPVGNMSEGCQVTLYDYWLWLYPILTKNVDTNNKIKYTLLEF